MSSPAEPCATPHARPAIYEQSYVGTRFNHVALKMKDLLIHNAGVNTANTMPAIITPTLLKRPDTPLPGSP